MSEIQEYLETELTKNVAIPVATLSCRSFGDSGDRLDVRVEKMLAAVGSQDPEKTTGRRFVIWNGEKAVAHARTFVRTMFVANQAMNILALASVCTDPDVRGHGLGAGITRKAFEQIGQPGWPTISMFQTPVPEFYEKLDCRVVTNRFVNRRNTNDPESNPWRDDTVMIYPAGCEWPNGIVDLNGPDY